MVLLYYFSGTPLILLWYSSSIPLGPGGPGGSGGPGGPGGPGGSGSPGVFWWSW